ncbi:flavodoxin domain-containing protein [Vibrio sp. F74]|uniref:flavodoxin domain-containing protein n=1 Tax=Vibrio sp. F74 TaxID=700020 RepID=UPI0035F5CDC0
MNKITHALMSILFSPVYEDQDILVCYASQTGTAANLASQSGDIIRKLGRTAEVQSLSSLQPADFKRYKQVLLIVSTCGEGDIPDNGILFYEQLKDFPTLDIPVGILALGDKSYSHYCLAGKLFHNELLRMGLATEDDLVMVNGNPMQDWQNWLSQQLEYDIDISQTKSVNTPVKLVLAEKIPLHTSTCVDNSNQAFHLRFDIQGNITQPYLVNDLVGITPPGSAKERLYSIASSPTENPNQISLCVAKHQFVLDGKLTNGLCSDFLTEHLPVGHELVATIKPGAGMSLPLDDIPAILIATGAGIAPMMSLLEERRQQLHSGKNWLVFGNRHAESDFYYQQKLIRYVAEGVITQLDTAFSRDSEQKVYVQDKLNQHNTQLAGWLLDDGAQVYVCGRPELKAEILAVFKDALATRYVDEQEVVNYLKAMLEDGQITFELF